MKNVLIAMSGGVDSSVVACIMKNTGNNCVGTTMKLFELNELGIEVEPSCCSSKDIEDATSVANKLGFPFYVCNFKNNFKECVIDNFVCSYKNGLTPNPCVECNKHLKFKALFDEMKKNNMDYVATGHYARVEYDEKLGRYILKKAMDETKDQSYVLYSLTQEKLAHILFPLGNLTKVETRRIAENNGLVNYNKPDSQDICFVKNGDYVSFINGYTGETAKEGNFVDINGKILGRHKGIIHYTIGQRKGLGISLSEPMYVVNIIPETNTIVLGKNEDLFSNTLIIKNINLIPFDKFDDEIRVMAKIRYKHEGAMATAIMIDNNTIKITFDEPQRAITKGQTCVMYDGDIVVGGGTIC